MDKLERFMQITDSHRNGQFIQMADQIDELSTYHNEKADFCSYLSEQAVMLGSTTLVANIWRRYWLVREDGKENLMRLNNQVYETTGRTLPFVLFMALRQLKDYSDNDLVINNGSEYSIEEMIELTGYGV